MKDCEAFCLLENLTKLGALKNYVTIKTADFGKIIGLSQQTSSRKLSELEKKGYIKRIISRSGTRIKISQQGMKFLENEIKSIISIEKFFSEISFAGKVVTGMGEGSYYMTRKGYIDQFKKFFNEIPYPGTFNLEVDDETIERLNYLKNNSKIKLTGFVENGRTFGDVFVQRAKINGINCYIVFPERGHYKNVVEIVSAVNLRKALKVNDGDLVRVEINSEPI
ncbi:MAG: DUF120 domain-containing protein [Thermoplasmata archaeon]|nr:DUF120 domain-containing protein [Thermoplasmata archaeon]